jgi:hypothetical protein
MSSEASRRAVAGFGGGCGGFALAPRAAASFSHHTLLDGTYRCACVSVYSLAALPAGVLDQPRAVDLGLARNREMNVRDYIRQQLQRLLRVDMLGMSAALDMRVPECHWTLSITARDVRFPHHWRRRQ